MSDDPVQRWRTAAVVAAVVATIATFLAGLLGGPGVAVGMLGWAIGLVSLIVIGWRLRARTSELVEVCRAFSAGDYQRRAAMPEGAMETLGSTLNALGAHLQATAVALARSQVLLDAALGALEEGVACIDLRDQVVYANRAYGRLLGNEQPTGRLFYIELADPRVANVVQAARRGEHTEPVRLLHGRTHLHVKAVAGNGEVVVLVLYDRTRIERLEMRRRDFTSAVSHELKTPLTSILGFAETALDDENIDLPTTRTFFERIFHHAERLSVLVRDIITISRLEEGDWAVHNETFDLTTLADDLLADFQDTAARSGIRLERLGAATLPVEHDPELMRMLLSNLVSNAIRYNRPQGTVWLRIFAVGDTQLRIEVEDTGIGISPEHQERVFERFYRVDSHRSRQSGGTGLGLSIVKHLLQRLHGRIELRSGPQGTCFTIHLPAGPASGTASSDDEPGARSTRM